jgi:hypothetical protein
MTEKPPTCGIVNRLPLSITTKYMTLLKHMFSVPAVPYGFKLNVPSQH